MKNNVELHKIVLWNWLQLPMCLLLSAKIHIRIFLLMLLKKKLIAYAGFIYVAVIKYY